MNSLRIFSLMYRYKVAPLWSWLVVALHLLCQFDAVKFQPRSIPSNTNMPQAELVQFKFHISIRDLEDAVSASSGLRSEIEQVIMADTAVIFKLLGPTHGLPSCRAKADQVTASGRGY
jgi:hypothetical protein